MSCPKCNGKLRTEDGVTYCEECLFVVERVQKENRGRPKGSKNKIQSPYRPRKKVAKPGLSKKAKQLIVRILIELRNTNKNEAYEAGISICKGVFGCLPKDLPEYMAERDKIGR